MKVVAINATEREDLGGKFARKLRKEGAVPCVVYGGEKPVHFSASVLSFKNLVYTSDAVKAEIVLGDNKIEAIVQDIQFHPVTDQIVHIDFIQLVDGKPVVMDIPVTTTGIARGVRNGGKLNQFLRTLKVKALPGDLPESIELNIEDLRIGQAIRISDLKKGNFEFLNPESAVIVTVKMSRGAMDEEEEEEEGEEGAEEGAEEASAESAE